MDRLKTRLVATVIGDVVGSRRAADRAALHTRLRAAVDAVNARCEPADPVRITVGDEFQGGFDTVGAAIGAAFLLRLTLLPHVDARFGLGWGEVTVLDPEQGTQDGPGWWAAREAIDAVKAAQARPGLRLVRTAYRLADTPGPTAPAVNAALDCRDHLVGSLDDRALQILRGLLDERSQVDLAAEVGISASAVSQRVRTGGLAVVIAAEHALESIA